jgi:Cu+-exporting ATPase
VISWLFDSKITSEDRFSNGLKSQLDSNGLSYILAPLSAENHVALISVEGMTCNSCVKLIESTTPSSDGVRGVKVLLEAKEAFIQFNPTVTTAEKVSTAIYDMGFDTELKNVYKPPTLERNASASVGSDLREVVVDIEPPAGEFSYTCIAVEGMVCHSCVNNIESNISKLDGVREVKASLEDKNARIAYDPKLVNPEKLASEIDSLGFEAQVMSAGSVLREYSKSPEVGVLKVCYVGIDGMTCKSCVNLIESTLGDMEGVVSVQVSLPLKEGTVEYNDALVSVDGITKAIDDMGFIVSYVTGELLPPTAWISYIHVRG